MEGKGGKGGFEGGGALMGREGVGWMIWYFGVI